jgi:hypothetical protein
MPKRKGEKLMDLRDAIAIETMKSILQTYVDELFSIDEKALAELCFRITDAMIAERNKGGINAYTR